MLPQKPVDEKKPRGEKYTTHTTLAVHGQMFFEIQMNYSVLPDPETMSANTIATYYRAIQKSLLRLSKVET